MHRALQVSQGYQKLPITRLLYNDGSDAEWESRVSGDTWTLTGSRGENGSMKVRCITVFSDAGETRSGKWEYSKDGAAWRVFLDSTATKV